MNSDRIACLTGIRGFAAIWVILYHVRDFWARSFPDFETLNKLVSVGFLGVDLFSFLSGFIIAYVYCERLATPSLPGMGRFLWLRFARTYPLHLFVLALFLVKFAYDRGISSLDIIPYDQSFLRQLFLINGWGFEHQLNWNIPSWTLSAEWLCYLLFPIAAPALVRVRSAGTALMLAISTVAVTALALHFVGQSFSATHQWGALRIGGEFLAGCWLYRAQRAGFPAAVPFGWIGLCALAGSVGIIALNRNMSHLDFTCVVGAFAVLVLALAQNEQPLRLLFGNPVAVYLGELSYSIYMLHWLVAELHLPFPPTFPPLLVILSSLTITISASALTYHFVEQPSRKRLRGFLP